MPNAIEVEHVSKRYLLGEHHGTHGTLRDAIGASTRRLLRRDGASAKREIWSLRDIALGDFEVDVAMAEAPHGTAPSLQGKNLANPMAMLLACAALLSYAAASGRRGADRASRAIYESVLEATASGCRTIDLGGHATTSEFSDAVVSRVRTKVDVWASLGGTI